MAAYPATTFPVYAGPWREMRDHSVIKEGVFLPLLVASPFTPDPLASDAENAIAEQGQKQQLSTAQKDLDKAFLILSQAPTGRWLLEESKNKSFKVAFDTRQRLEKEGAIAECAIGLGVITLNPQASLEHMVLHLAHECAHARLADSVVFDPKEDAKLSFLAQVHKIRLAEADAHALTCQCIYELAHGDHALGFAGANPKQAVFPVFKDVLKEYSPEDGNIFAVYESVAAHEGVLNGAPLAAAHEAFYAQPRKLTIYEQVVHERMREVHLPHLRAVKAARDDSSQELGEWCKLIIMGASDTEAEDFFWHKDVQALHLHTDKMDNVRYPAALSWFDASYLNTQHSLVNYADPFHGAISATTQDVLLEGLATMRMPSPLIEDTLSAPLRQPARIAARPSAYDIAPQTRHTASANAAVTA